MRTPVLLLPQSRETAGTHTYTETVLFVTVLWNVAGHYYANEQIQTLVKHCLCLHETVRSEDMVKRV